MKREEIELKLRLPGPRSQARILEHLAARGHRFRKLTRRRIEDLYLDTFEWTLLKKQYVLRLRKQAGRTFVTLKSVGRIDGGIARREEIEARIDREIVDPSFIPDPKVRKLVDGLIHPRKLLEQVRVSTERQPYELTLSGGARLELCFDTTTFAAAGFNKPRQARGLMEMEAELLQGDPGVIEGLSQEMARSLRYRPSKSSKLELAIAQLGIEIPAKRPPPALSVKLGDRSGEAVKKILTFQYQRLHTYLPGVHLDLDTEFVHQARVASRRMRSALGLFRGILPERTEEFFAKELKWLAGALGDLRDLDVFLLNLPRLHPRMGAHSAKQRKILEHWIRAYRADRLKRLKQTLTSGRFRNLDTRFRGYLRARPAPVNRRVHGRGAKPLRTLAPEIIMEKWDAVLKHARRIEANPKLEDYHRLRIEMKNLRYACEFVQPAYDDALEQLIRKTVKIQDCLGELQDTVFTRNFVQLIMRKWRGRVVEPESIFMLGEIHQLQDEIARQAMRRFQVLWRIFDERTQREELERVLREGR
jgi:CHAD domain-containing protein